MTKELPSPDSLHTIAKQAAYNYQQHLRIIEKASRYYKVPLGAAALARVESLTEKGAPLMRKGESYEESRIRITQGRVKGNLERAGEHYRQHQSEYHDLAVIDAHLDGIKISVEQPLEIGQKIEVHSPEHQ